MKSLVEILNEGLTIRPKIEYNDFTDVIDALDWLGTCNADHCIANINIKGQVGQLSWGHAINVGRNPIIQNPDRLFLICNLLDFDESDLTDDYETMNKKEFANKVKDLIIKYGDN